MGISLRPEHLQRYKDVARLLMKYGRSDLVTQAGLEDVFHEDEDNGRPTGEETRQKGVELAEDLERMGPTFIKLGQLLSTRADLIPPPYLESLARLQDSVEPFPFAEVERIVAEELGVRLSKAFADFEATPIAAASLGQVHRAALRDGRQVAVKVQRPGIRERIREDLEALEEMAEFLDRHTAAGRSYHFGDMLEEFRLALARELDYRREARNLERIRRNLAEFRLIVVPAAVEDYTTSRVLTMEYLTGTKITSLSPLARMELDGQALAEEMFRAYLKQILVDGFFHADPHPGNVFVTRDRRIALLDLGMVAEITPQMQEHLLKLVLDIAEMRADEAAQIALSISELSEEHDGRAFTSELAQLIARHGDVRAEEVEVGRVVMEMTRIGGENGVRLPPELTLLGKALLNLDHVGRTLDPDFQPNAAIRRNAGEVMRQRMLKSLSPTSMLSTALEMNELVQQLPARLNRLLDSFARNEFSLRVDAFNERHMVEGLQKIANRITLGVIIAALIVGAALLMRVETDFRILGYPGLAIVLFLAAAAAGVILGWNIIQHDREIRGDGKRRRPGA
jgi:ubiquinone biosynthesis protein